MACKLIEKTLSLDLNFGRCAFDFQKRRGLHANFCKIRRITGPAKFAIDTPWMLPAVQMLSPNPLSPSTTLKEKGGVRGSILALDKVPARTTGVRAGPSRGSRAHGGRGA